jgi:fimbrial isopeptide formation D2 family protein/uncharacterized repeat protein (TIGR01451 family)
MNSSFQRFQHQSWLIGSLALLISLGWSKAVHAEGSADLIENGGSRPFLEYRNDILQGTSIRRQSIIKVYAQTGETINLASSAVGIGSGRIDFFRPDGTQGTCPGGVGSIANVEQERAGPKLTLNDPIPNRYTPCQITVGPGQTGVWEINFVSPNPTNQANPTPRQALSNWSPQPNGVGYVAAWDVTVTSGGTAIPGRAYANYLSLNLGGNNQSLNSETFIQTREGFLYRVNLNGLDPFGFIFFANNKGFRDGAGNPLYRSVPLNSGLNVHNPGLPDDEITKDTTHKIFFNPPDLNLPQSAPVPNAPPTWLRNPPLSPLPAVSNLEFIGVQGTPNQAGPTLGGNFVFESNSAGNYVITIDVNRNGTFGDEPDRILSGQTVIGKNTIFWDGKDSAGNPLTAGTTPYQSKLSFFTGDVHFPFLDPENNPVGLIIQRVNPTNTIVEDSTVYYNDSGLPLVGSPTNPISALAGIDSSPPGVHKFGNGTELGFGNENGIDTWTSLVAPITLLGDILIQKADLSLNKTDEPDPVVAGGSISYGLAVTSNQPPPDDSYSLVKGARVTDTVPPEITGVTWTCAITSGTGACGTESGTGNNIDLTLDLDVGAIATITVNGTVSPSAPAQLNNTATVERPPDVTDPNPDNNTDPEVTSVTASPPPVANKSVRFLRDNDGTGNLTIGDDIEYKIVVRNPNAVPISNLVISDAIPIQWQVLRDASNPITVDSGFSLASTLPSSGFESTGSSVAFTEPGTLAPGATVTLTFNVRIRPGSASPLVNQGTVNFQGDNGNPVLTDASDSTNPTAPGSGVNPGNPNPLNPDGSGGNVNQPNAGNADPTIINLVSPVTPTGTKSVRLVTDSDGSGSVSTGDTLEYTITYSNPTASDINNFLVTDSIDSNGLSFVSGSYSLTGTGTGTTVAANPNYNGTTDINLNTPGTLGRGGGQVVIKYRAVVTAAAGAEIRNQASATSIGGSVNPSVTDAIQGPGDLPQLLDDGINQGNIPGNTGDDDPTVLKVGVLGGSFAPVANKSVRFLRDNDGTGNLTIGDDIEYKIVVRNPNAVPISNLVISDAIPIQWQVLRDASNPITVDSGFSLASTLPSSGFESTGSSVAFTEPGTLAPGATVTLTFNVRIRPGSASPLVNQGTVNFQGDNGNPVLTDASDSTNPTAPGSGVNPGNPNPLNPDGSGGNVNQPNAGDADPTIINLVSPVTPTGTKSVRLVTDSDGSGSVSTGDTLEYTITYSNPTASDINNFLVTDSIDSNGLSFVSGSYSLTGTGTGTTVAANPNYNGTTDINLNTPGTLGRGGGQVVIKYRAVVTAAAGAEIRNQASATSIGGSVNPSVTDALQGPGDLPQLLDDGINQGNIPGNTGDDDPTVLRVGGSGTGACAPVANKSVRFLRDNDGTGNLTIGDDIEYKIVVQNRNPRAITNLTVSDAIPFQWQVLRDASNPITVDSGFSLASPPALPSSSFVSTGNSVTFTNPGTLAPGATLTLTFNVRIRPGSPSPLINQGTINFQGDNGNPVLTDASDSTNPTAPGSDVNPGNPSPLNPDGSGGNVNQPNAGNADPTIIKFVSPITPTGTKSVRLVTDADGSGAVTTGDTLEYTITYSNTSSSDVNNFLVTDSIDSNGLSFVSGSYSLSATGTGTTVAANPNYNGTTDTNLNTVGTLGRGGGQVVIKYRAVVLAAAGTKINNQARATSIGGNVSQSLTDALQGPGDLPQVLDDGINQGNLSDTGDDEPTGVTVGDVGNPRLRLVKRITSVTRSGVPISGINFSTFVDDPADDNDNAPGWSQLSPVGVFRLGSEVSLQSGDEVEYTIYFLSDGAQNSRNIKFCDLIPAGTTFIPDSLGPGIGIRLRQGGTQSDQTNASDTDQGIFYSPLTPVTAPCSDPKNPNGAVFLQLGNVPNTAPNNAGLVRFRVRID